MSVPYPQGPYGEDYYWYPPHRYQRQPSPAAAYPRHQAGWLSPEAPPYGNGLHRSRSHGHAPAPQVNIYQDIAQDSFQRADPRYPSPSPSNSPRRGRRSALDDDLLSVGEELAMERLRSRSRGRSDAAWYELERVRDAEKMDKELELAAMRRERERKEEDDRIEAAIAERERHHEREKRERQEAIDRWKLDEEKEKEKKKAEVEKWKLEEEKKKKEKEEHEKEMKALFKRQEEEKKEKEKQEWEEFLLKQKLEKEKKEKEEKEAEEKAEELMAKKMRKAGYTESEIKAALHPDKKKHHKQEKVNVVFNQPTYPKVHKDYLSVDTLIYYNLPYEYDKGDPNYIIILREMDRHETDVLFAHTRRLKEGGRRLLIEEKKPEKKYAWVRRKSYSPTGKDVKVMEIVRR
ncbi:MAG: hypothetical protein M1820_006837 [Bogoriella megaspora]|nr:MAG: hypothetical protein M1820_006837 [Bogoriella megaspora]